MRARICQIVARAGCIRYRNPSPAYLWWCGQRMSILLSRAPIARTVLKIPTTICDAFIHVSIHSALAANRRPSTYSVPASVMCTRRAGLWRDACYSRARHTTTKICCRATVDHALAWCSYRAKTIQTKRPNYISSLMAVIKEHAASTYLIKIKTFTLWSMCMAQQKKCESYKFTIVSAAQIVNWLQCLLISIAFDCFPVGSLQNLCMETILSSVERDSVDNLPLPPKIKHHLLNFWACPGLVEVLKWLCWIVRFRSSVMFATSLGRKQQSRKWNKYSRIQSFESIVALITNELVPNTYISISTFSKACAPYTKWIPEENLYFNQNWLSSWKPLNGDLCFSCFSIFMIFLDIPLFFY